MAIAVNTTSAFAYPDMMHSSTIDDEEFALWVELLGRRIGLRDSLIRKSFLAQSVEKRMRKCGMTSRRAYFELLRADKGNEEEWGYLIDLLPLHETRFFRHDSSLKLVRDYVRERCDSEKERLVAVNAWSVGCSSGEEAYSLAIVIDDALAGCTSRPRYSVTGSDVSQQSLDIARRGTYHRRQLTNMSTEQIAKAFIQVDHDSFAVKPLLRDRTQFVPVNICELAPRAGWIGPMDIIFCQNVLIYFDTPQRELIVNRLAEHLAPGGLLVLGAGELLRWNHPELKRVVADDTLAYQKQSALI